MEKNESTCDKEMPTHSGMMENHIPAVKACRKAMDEVIQMMRSLPAGQSQQIMEAIKKGQECQMWCGMELKRCKEMGYGDDPYPNSKDPSNTIIDPVADGLKM